MLPKLLFGGTNPRPLAYGHIALASLAAALAMAMLSFLAQSLELPLLLGSFGASCVLVFGYPESPFCRPSNVILGHFFCSLIGLAFFHLLGPAWWSLSLAMGTSVAVMLVTRQVHPPAGSNPVIVYLLHPGWKFAFFPTLAGAVVLVAIAWTWHRLKRRWLQD